MSTFLGGPQEVQENANLQRELTPPWKSEEEKNPTHVQNKMAHELKQHVKERQEEAKVAAPVEDKHIKIDLGFGP